MPASAVAMAKVAAKAPSAPLRPSGSVRSMFSRSASALKVSNGSRVNMMQVVNPHTKYYETLSYLPQLSDADIARQVEYITYNNWAPCIEFDCIGGGAISREHQSVAGYYDGRYWAMWKLPLFGCTDPRQVLEEIQACKREYPDSFVRIIGFDPERQVQVVSFIVAKPSGGGMGKRAAAVSKLDSRVCSHVAYPELTECALMRVRCQQPPPARSSEPVSRDSPNWTPPPRSAPPPPPPPPPARSAPVASYSPSSSSSASGLESRLQRMEDAIDRIEKALGCAPSGRTPP
eukprot:scaffold4267_cov393-Prasinococcus_capsulatus_cf.AAC.4